MDSFRKIAGDPAPQAGIAGRMVRGGFWNLGAQIITLLALFLTTPFVIRLLGPGYYGTLTLINLLVAYLAFADLGMGIASTRFGAEAFARNDTSGESKVVWTSLIVAILPLIVVSVTLVFAAGPLLRSVFKLDAAYQKNSTLALQLASLAIIATGASSVLNTPQLVRVRNDLNSIITAGSSVGQACLVLIVLFAGGNIVVVSLMMAVVSLATTSFHLFVSARLAPGLLRPLIDRRLIRPLVRFGFSVVFSALLGTIIIHGEKLFLARLHSVTQLAYYNVAFALAGLLGMMPSAMAQPMMPSFVHFRVVESRESLANLFNGVLHILFLWALPATLTLCVFAKPFITVWAGPDFGRESVWPLYVLLLGGFFNAISTVPRSLLIAWDRVGVIARYQTWELLPYFILIFLLVRSFGIVGAAAAWSLRVVVETFLLFHAIKPAAGIDPSPLPKPALRLAIALAILILPVLLVHWFFPGPVATGGATLLSLCAYTLFVVKRVLTQPERAVIVGQFLKPKD